MSVRCFRNASREDESMSARIGRTSKGDRHVIVTRPQRPVADVVIREAAAAGMSISDYVAAVLAHAHGMSQYAPRPQVAIDQQELPLKTA